ALLSLGSNIPPARANANAVDAVVVACPDLPQARTAELEARARATLLTSDLSATVAISCVGERVVVHVNVGDDSVTLKVRVQAATLREEALRALDRALADLSARVTPEGQTAAPTSAPNTRTGSAVPPPGTHAAADGPNAADTRPSSATHEPDQTPIRETEVGALVLGESWRDGLALGGGLRAAVRFDSTWSCGIRAGGLYPAGLREATVVEAHAMLEAAVTARGLAGLRFTLGAGPSLLFASPASGFVAPSATLKSALRFEAQIGRPIRWQKAELTPWVGARAFTAERGVRVAERTRLVLGSAQPQVGVALSLIH
ncbi:MAG TPA: hypothetical protein VIM73_19545, partial [Polyangiaceae bacterium]